MKTRSGFVSNSSSSSFVLKVGEPFDTAKEVAEYMIPKRCWKDRDDETLANLKNCGDHKHLSFNSCNYNTFIAEVDGYFLVETCNNHGWGLYDFRSSKYPGRFLDDYGDDRFYNLSNSFDFYNLEYNIVGHTVSWMSNDSCCKKCHAELWVVNGETQCNYCESLKKN